MRAASRMHDLRPSVNSLRAFFVSLARKGSTSAKDALFGELAGVSWSRVSFAIWPMWGFSSS